MYNFSGSRERIWLEASYRLSYSIARSFQDSILCIQYETLQVLTYLGFNYCAIRSLFPYVLTATGHILAVHEG